MNTAEKLEGITNRPLFEFLVTSILRNFNKDYASIIHTGVNSKGETIKSPVDGFCLVPGSDPSHFILVQHTTFDKERLERKWLYDHTASKSIKTASENDDGDLIKAGREARKIRGKFPSAKFTVVLATNQTVSFELAKKISEKCLELQVSGDIWEQSRIVGYLDQNAEGQYLRKKFLKIDAERLSLSLLRELCGVSLELYERFQQHLTSPDVWVPREADQRVGSKNNHYSIQFLVGESGSGKSTAAFRYLQKCLTSGGYGLWVPAELIQESISLEDALDNILHRLAPNLLPSSGRAALNLLAGNSKLLMVVDDVNRTDAPLKLIKKLLSWARPKVSEDRNSEGVNSPFLFIVPTWPRFRELLIQDLSITTWVDTTVIGHLSKIEGAKAIRTVVPMNLIMDDREVELVATRLNNDPILIGLLGSLLRSNQNTDIFVLAEDVVQQFISQCLNETSSALDSRYLPDDYRAALASLADFLLRNRRNFPLWEEVRAWFGNLFDQANYLRELIRNGNLCRLSKTPEGEQLTFRHDRIRDSLLVESISKMLLQDGTDWDVLTDPYYSELVGRALTKSLVSKELLTDLRDKNPLALAEAMRLGISIDLHYLNSITTELAQWANDSLQRNSIPQSMINTLCWSFVETDSASVLDITSDFPEHWILLLARFRNGCTKSGIEYCIKVGRHRFLPMHKDILREQAINQAKKNHKDQVIRELRQTLVSPSISDQERGGALILTGLLGIPDLIGEIRGCWDLVVDKSGYLLDAIWAAIQCYVPGSEARIDPLMDFWEGLSEEYEYGSSPKGRIGIDLGYAGAYGIPDRVISYLTSQCDKRESLRWPISIFLHRIDAPDAMEFIVRCSSIDSGITDGWDNSLPYNRSISNASLLRLKNLWEDENNDDRVRRRAFALWLTGIDWAELESLRNISEDSPTFKQSVYKRTQLGDQSVVSQFIKFLESDFYWFRVAHNVWCDQLLSVTDNYLDRIKDAIPSDFSGGRGDEPHFLAELLTRIPKGEAEALIDKYWDRLSYSAYFIQAALYIGTTLCLELADQSIKRWPQGVPLFTGISWIFGLYLPRNGSLTLEHLNNLLPYLDRFEESELLTLALECQNSGFMEWGQKHLASRLDEKDKKRFYPSDEDLMEELNEFLTRPHGEDLVYYWLEEFSRRHESTSRAISIIDRWLSRSPVPSRLKIAAICLNTVGTRKDLAILDKYDIQGPSDEISSIKADCHYAVRRRSLD